MPGNNFDGFEIKAAISSETVSNEVWKHLAESGEHLLKTIRFTFRKYGATFDEEDAVEVLHDTFLRVVLKIDQYDPSRSFLSWTRGIARHRTIDVLRDRTKQFKISGELTPSPKQLIKKDKDEIGHPDDALDIAEEYDGLRVDEARSDDEARREAEAHYTYEYGEDAHLAALPKTRIFQRELAQLSNKEQELIIDHWGNHVPLADLARRANIKDAAMRKRAERVREKLYLRLIKYEEFSDLKLSRIKESLPDR
jgi:RNA polymerase sigma factor (sigma-70 family)